MVLLGVGQLHVTRSLPRSCLTWPATPSLPLAPRPAGHLTEVPLPTFAAQSGLMLDRVVGENEGGTATIAAVNRNDIYVWHRHSGIL